ncbi:SDR family NAD(P)-dependent oxidoreductase [Sporolactobacillus pectinivorans]|uniref:SDR family NAD(P)-dependent oxidoreductase n=1 Tax=Sporolactobacillus pectinivorans TaxID=1591408 RepID=UPI000C264062|nr:SDR family oxidoreductase [Sporolactobacillus pectinivorans]
MTNSQDAKTTALVTGATSGIGRAVAIQLASKGISVIVQGRNTERGAEVVKEIIESGGHAKFQYADLSKHDDVLQLIKDVNDVDILVNNAGIAWFGDSMDLDIKTFNTLFSVNVRAPYFLVSAFAPKMAEKGTGSIINIGSMAGQVGLSAGAAYGATKGAIASLTRAWAAEFGAKGVRINTISPGPTFTSGASEDVIEALGATTPFKRAANVAEIAKAVAFLAISDSSYITGANIAVDGGRTAV